MTVGDKIGGDTRDEDHIFESLMRPGILSSPREWSGGGGGTEAALDRYACLRRTIISINLRGPEANAVQT